MNTVVAAAAVGDDDDTAAVAAVDDTDAGNILARTKTMFSMVVVVERDESPDGTRMLQPVPRPRPMPMQQARNS